jgi:polyphosphate kinase 2 (PPK2 family)
MNIQPRDFRVSPGTRVDLQKWPARAKRVYSSKKHYHTRLEQQVEDLNALQRLHCPSGRYAVLLIFQGMDGAGKDGAIRHVLFGINPQGCEVSSFTQPSAEELEHAFLWRTTRRLPERGRIGALGQTPS